MDEQPFGEALPVFYGEVLLALNSLGETDLARQLPHLNIAGRCECQQPDCSSFYVHSASTGAVGARVVGSRYWRSVALDTKRGMVVIDVDHAGRITFVEVLHRVDVFEELSRLGV
jgi:hypothetical protein